MATTAQYWCPTLVAGIFPLKLASTTGDVPVHHEAGAPFGKGGRDQRGRGDVFASWEEGCDDCTFT